MGGGVDRRAVFFVGAAVVSFLLFPVTEHEHRWVPLGLGVVYVLLALASWADRRGRSPGQTQIIERPRSPGADT
jgi:hypothetical protein